MKWGKRLIALVIAIIVLTSSVYAVETAHHQEPHPPEIHVSVVKAENVTAIAESEGDYNQAYYVEFRINGTLSPSQLFVVTKQGGKYQPSSFPLSNYSVTPLRGEGVEPFVVPAGETPEEILVKDNGSCYTYPFPSTTQLSLVDLNVMFGLRDFHFLLEGTGEIMEVINVSSPVPLNVSAKEVGKVNVSVRETCVVEKTKLSILISLPQESIYENLTVPINVTYSISAYGSPIEVNSNFTLFNVTLMNHGDKAFQVNASDFVDGGLREGRSFFLDGMKEEVLNPGEEAWGIVCFPGKSDQLYLKLPSFYLPVQIGSTKSSFSSITLHFLSNNVNVSPSTVRVEGFSGEGFNFTLYLYNPHSNEQLLLNDVEGELPLQYVHALLLQDSGENVTFSGQIPDLSIFGELNMTLTFLDVG